MKKIILLLLTTVYTLSLFCQKQELKFDENGEFKIVQFTDLHFSFHSLESDTTLAIIESVTNIEKPNLIIFTGDIVTDIPSREGWYKLGAALERIGIPWAITLGNHDDEPSIGRGEIFDLVDKMPYFIGEKGPALSGVGNYVLLIDGHNSNKPAGALYCMDSHGFGKFSKLESYDWFHLDQILWYKEQSELLTAANGGKPLPSLAFFHIPLPEYKDLGDNILGSKPYRVSSPKVNSGMFVSMLEQNDILGMFVGHDHNNDYVGKFKDIVLAYGRVSGVDASGRPERGGRVIVMYENQYKLDTWIRTPTGKEFEYQFPANTIVEDETAFNYLPAMDINPQRQGLNYKYYLGDFKNTDEVLKAESHSNGNVNNFSFDFSPVRDLFAIVFEGFIEIPETDVYSFYTTSDDGSRLYIDDTLVVDNDGSHAGRRRDGIVGLEKGFHKIKLIYFEGTWGEYLEVGYAAKNMRENLIPDYVLFSE